MLSPAAQGNNRVIPRGRVNIVHGEELTMTGTEPLFQGDAYLRSCTARVVEVAADGVVLDRTVFYPLGGGQPGDRGTLRTGDGRELAVIDTRKG